MFLPVLSALKKLLGFKAGTPAAALSEGQSIHHSANQPATQPEWVSRPVLALFLSLLLAVSAMFLINTFQLNQVLEDLELKTYDARAGLKLTPGANGMPSQNIVIVKFDDPSLAYFEDEFGTWPWPRSVHSEMMDYLIEAQAKLVAYDILFVSRGKNRSQGDERLINAFKRYPNVYISMNFDNNRDMIAQIGKHITPQSYQALKPFSVPIEFKFKPSNGNLNLGPDGFYASSDLTFDNFRPLMSELMAVGERVGVVNHSRDPDGISRSNPLFFRLQQQQPIKSPALPYRQDEYTGQWLDAKGQKIDAEGILLDAAGQPKQQISAEFYPFLGLRMVMDMKWPPDKRRWQQMSVDESGYLNFPGYHIPLDANGKLMIKWYNINVDQLEAVKNIQKLEATRSKLVSHPLNNVDQQAFLVKKLNDAIANQQRVLGQLASRSKPYQEVPVWKIVKSLQNKKQGVWTEDDAQLKRFFKNKIIFIGTTAVSTYDIKSTPVDKVMPGVVLQATLFDNLYQNTTYMRRLEPLWNILLTGMLCIAACLAIIKLRSALAGMLTTAAMAMLYGVLVTLAFEYWALWINLAAPLLAVFGTTMLTYMVKYIGRNQDFEATYQLATTDVMTGLKNHRFFQEHLIRSVELARRFGSPFSLLLIDIDFFKKFNDTYGHQAGDDVLRQVSQRIKQGVRAVDLVARYGGEELAVVLDKTTQYEAVDIANKLVQLMNQTPFTIKPGVSQSVTISVGVATYPRDGLTPSELIAHADQGLYQAKDQGRNQVGIYTGSSAASKVS